MSRSLKYIRFVNSAGEDRIWIFSSSYMHSDVRDKMPGLKPVSAGFVRMGIDGVEAYGYSQSLGVASDREKDTDLLRQELGEPIRSFASKLKALFS